MKPGKFKRRVLEMRSEGAKEGAPLGGTRAEAAQRLQVGLAGLGSMVLLVGLASVLGNQADRTEESSVPEAAPTTEPTEAVPQSDPLVDAGILPDVPVEQDANEVVEDVAPPGAVEDSAPPEDTETADGE